MTNEGFWLVLAGSLYGFTSLMAFYELKKRSEKFTFTLSLLGAALIANTIFILIRWERLGHGPYVDLRETLASSIWGYHLALLLGALFINKIRPALVTILPILLVMVAWALYLPARDSLLPVTYDTIWLPIHILLGKFFIGFVIIALALSGVILCRLYADKKDMAEDAVIRFQSMPTSRSLEELAFRFMIVAFLFDTAMLIVGAIWAQDAWGRYWDWDPLEIWSFLTWISIIFYLHLRITKKIRAHVAAILILVSFLFAFLTYFGMPFISQAAHQGVV